MTTKPQPPSIYEPDAYVVIKAKQRDVVVFQSDWCACQKFRHQFIKPDDFDIIPAKEIA
jgi:hypothetical protein